MAVPALADSPVRCILTLAIATIIAESSTRFIRSISSPIQPTSLVGSALARLKTVTYPYRHHRPYRMKFGFHHQQVTRNHQLRWMLFYPRFYP